MCSEQTRYEEILRDCIPFLQGFFLVIGYLLSLIMIAGMPQHEVSIEIQEPRYKKMEIGKVPIDHLVNEKSPGFKPVYANIPEIDTEGKLILQKRAQTFRGRGTPIVRIENIYEITMPKMANPPWRKKMETETMSVQTPTGRSREIPTAIWVTYAENIEDLATGVYYVTKKVEFDVGINPNSYAIYGAMIGTALSFFITIFKYVKRFRKTKN